MSNYDPSLPSDSGKNFVTLEERVTAWGAKITGGASALAFVFRYPIPGIIFLIIAVVCFILFLHFKNKADEFTCTTFKHNHNPEN